MIWISSCPDLFWGVIEPGSVRRITTEGIHVEDVDQFALHTDESQCLEMTEQAADRFKCEPEVIADLLTGQTDPEFRLGEASGM